jgi:hypothetical protein
MTLIAPSAVDIPIVISQGTLGGFHQVLVIVQLFKIEQTIALAPAVRKPASRLAISIKPYMCQRDYWESNGTIKSQEEILG